MHYGRDRSYFFTSAMHYGRDHDSRNMAAAAAKLPLTSKVNSKFDISLQCDGSYFGRDGSYFVTSVMHYRRDNTGRFLAYYGQHNQRSTNYFRSKSSFLVCYQPRFCPIVIG